MARRETQALIKAASKGDVAAQLALGRLYLVGETGLAPNQSAAMNWLTRARKGGSAAAADEIAEHITPPLKSDITTPDYVAACKEASARGSAAADFGLGTVHSRAGDVGAAIDCFRRAAEAGHAAAARRLGEMLVSAGGGGGDETSPQTARAWLEEAAARGDAGAVKPLAELLWRQADPAAEPWLRQLATDGDTESMARLAELLLGVPRVSGQLEP